MVELLLLIKICALLVRFVRRGSFKSTVYFTISLLVSLVYIDGLIGCRLYRPIIIIAVGLGLLIHYPLFSYLYTVS